MKWYVYNYLIIYKYWCKYNIKILCVCVCVCGCVCVFVCVCVGGGAVDKASRNLADFCLLSL